MSPGSPRSKLPADYDVVVIGGGPAGSAASRLLSLWGRRVCLITRPEPDRRPLAESVPPSAGKLLDVLGVATAIQRARFQPSRGNTVWWGAAPARIADFPDGSSGLQVIRSDLEAVLLSESVRAGTDVRTDSTVRTVDLDTEPAGVRYSSPDGTVERVTGRIVLDCSGRAGVIGDRLRVHDDANATVALCGIWRSDDWGLPDPTHTLVESYRDGWVWSIPTSARERFVTVMVDPRRTELSTGRSRLGVYRSELAKTRRARDLVAGADFEGDVWGHTASQYSAERYEGAGFLLVGDAGSFIDPLSSFGVKKALASGWLAAVVVNTELEDPATAGPARALFERRERYVWDTYRSLAARFYREAAEAHGHEFWTSRARAAPAAPGTEDPSVAFLDASDPLDTGGEPDVDAFRRDPRVLSSFAQLRQAPGIRLRPGEALQRIQGPAVQGRRIVLEDRLAAEDLEDGIRYLRGIDLVHLVEIAPAHEQVPDLFDAYCRTRRPVILPDFLGALSVLLARGLLVNEWA